MKKALLGLLALMITLVAFASPVPKEQLQKINDYLRQMSPRDTVKITSAEIDDSTKLLSAAQLEAILFQQAKLKAGVALKGQNLKLNLSVEGNISTLGASREELIEQGTKFMTEIIKKINARGDYNASLKAVSNTKGATLTVTLAPSATNTAPSIKKLTIKAAIPMDVVAKSVKIALTGDLNTTAEHVKNGQVALTNIFTSLGNSQEPKDEDMEALGKIISDALRGLNSL